MLPYLALFLCGLAIFFGELDGATGSYTPNTFWLWLAVAALAIEALAIHATI